LSDPAVTVFHNPACGTSRRISRVLRERGLNPTVVEYLKVGWTAPQLVALLAKMGVPARDILRVRGTQAEALGLTDPATTDAAIIAAMVGDPALVERPIVETAKGAVLCRPKERVLEVL
jgi:arsenate reductase